MPESRLQFFHAIFLCFFVSVLLSPAAMAHDPDADKEKPPWEKSASLGFNLTRGNSENLLLTGSLRFDYAKEGDPSEFHFELSGSEGKTEDQDTGEEEVTQREIDLGVQYRHLFSDRFYGALGLNAEYDEVAAINYRVSIDPALGYYVVKEDDMRLAFEAGPSHVFEEVGDEPEELRNNYWAWRVAERFEWDISETSKLFQTAEVTGSFEDSEDTIVDAEIGVEAALSTMLSLVVTVTDTYDNLPAAGKKRNDLSLVSALKLSW